MGIKKVLAGHIFIGNVVELMITGGFKSLIFAKSLTGTDSLIARCTNANFTNRFEDTGILITE